MTSRTYPNGLSADLVNLSVERNMRAFVESGDEKKFHDLMTKEVPRAVNCTAPVREKYQRVINIVSEASSMMTKISACHNGCSHCCHQAVGISSYEAKVIADRYGIKAVNHRTNIDAIPGYVDKYSGVTCPFLEDGKCSIYDVRPIACRTHFNLSDYPEVCDVSNKGGTIPSPNFTSVWNSQVEIFWGHDFGDLREYFPDGLKTKI